MTQISIAIDGPASSGKSTVAKILAKIELYLYRYRCHVSRSNLFSYYEQCIFFR